MTLSICVFVVLCVAIVDTTSSVPILELSGLYALHNTTRGDYWFWKPETSYGPVWNFSSYPDVDPCNDNGQVWQGLSCSSAPRNCSGQFCHVITVDLSDYHLDGTLPPEIGNLNSLVSLNLGDNILTGLLPPELGKLSNLTKLHLPVNTLSGTIPTTLRKLIHVDIHSNILSGPLHLDSVLYPFLEFFSAFWNRFTGTIPDSVCRMTGLRTLSLATNKLQGPIPTCIGSLSKLARLDVSETRVSGSIPSSLGLLHFLTYLAMDHSSVTGTLPPSIGNCSGLKYFFASTTSLEGSIPAEWTKLTSLKDCRIAAAGLTGPLISGIGNWQHLSSKLDLGDNMLTGSIPSSFGLLTMLPSLLLANNRLTGCLPSELGSMVTLKYIYVSGNSLNGTIPTSLGRMTNLESLYLQDNAFTGLIPETLVDASKLIYLFMQGNLLTGSIPSGLGMLSKLYRMAVSANLLTGSIPSSFGSCTTLRMFVAESNFLTGPLPVGLGNGYRLETIRVGNNALTGPVFSAPTNAHLNVLDLQNNFFTGTLPSVFAILSVLRTINVNNNILSGTLPSDFSKATRLAYLDTMNNCITGTLPQNLGDCPLVELNVQHNYLSGTIPSSIGNITSLEMFLATGNKLTGHIESMLWQAAKMQLEIIDLSDNLLEGRVPQAIFALPFLRVLALTYNCFHGELPGSICSAVNVSVLSMDGLSAQRGCENTERVPLTSARLYRKIQGSIPMCVFQLPSLESLHLSGNGLSGTLSAIPQTAKLLNMSLSHNRISGTIPLSVTDRHWEKLDISYNKLQGQCSHFAESSYNQSFALDVNRLSGKYPRNLLVSREVRVLADNLFSCNGTPRSDSSTDEYSCGSTELDIALYTTCVVCGVLVVLVTLETARCWGIVKNVNNTGLVNRIVQYNRSIYDDIASCDKCIAVSDLPKLGSLCQLLADVPRDFCVVMGIGLLCCCPVYILKFAEAGHAETQYATHSHLYSWAVSMVYVTGEVPAALLLVSGMISLAAVASAWVWRTHKYGRQCPVKTSIDGGKLLQTTTLRPLSQSVTLYCVLLLNICLVATINALYVYSTLRSLSRPSRLIIQFAMAAFKSVYSLIVIPTCSARFVHHSLDKSWFKVSALIVSGLVAPAVVTVFTSPSCFQGLLVDPEPIDSTYTYLACTATIELGSKFSCVLYSMLSVDVIPVTPPLTYNYMCTSVLLSAYIPVYLYAYGLQIILQVVLPVLHLHWTGMPMFIRRLEHGVLWPDQWTAADQNSWHLLKAHALVSSFLGHLAILLTFGMFYPPLGIVIVLTCMLHSLHLRRILGGFIRFRLELQRVTDIFSPRGGERQEAKPAALGSDVAMQCLENNASGWIDAVEKCLWPLSITVSLFYSLLCWDLAGDDVGWRESVWVPASSASCMCLMLGCVKYSRSDMTMLRLDSKLRSCFRYIMPSSIGEDACGENGIAAIEIVSEEQWSSMHKST